MSFGLAVRVAIAAVTFTALAGCTMSTGQAKLTAVPPVVLSALSAEAGALAGGEKVTVTGHSLASVAAVTFGGQKGTDLTIVSNSVLTVVVPHSLRYVAGPVPVRFDTGFGHDTQSWDTDLTYTYQVLTAVDSQLHYAFAHWNDYNLAEYGDFTSWGGDCMDFVSQTLVARGWAVTGDWYNDAQDDWAPAFVDVPSFDEWLGEHPEYGAVRLPMSARDEVGIGDIVMMDWDADGSLDHAQIVSGILRVKGVTHILMVGHDIDTDYRDLDASLAAEGKPGALAYFWILPAA